MPSYSSEKIVYLDVEKIMQESIAGKAIITKIKKKRDTSISKFKKKEKDIFEKEKKLISQKNILSDEEFKKKNSRFKGGYFKLPKGEKQNIKRYYTNKN